MELCPAHSSARYNVGCRCESPQAEEPDCSPDYGGDQVLYNAYLDTSVTGGIPGFVEWCEAYCICAPRSTADVFQSYTPQQQAGIFLDDFLASQGGGSQGGGSQGGDSQGGESILTGSNSTVQGFDGLEPTTGIVPGNFGDFQLCNSSLALCTMGADCIGDDCICKVTGTRFEPRAGTLEYFASCGYNPKAGLLGGKTKRQHSQPCPCNTTYVSYGCCDSEDGMIWEAPKLKIGELVKDTES
ncbi:MAG: hypothetical protein M1828_004100 [Chrysothrix sp. TS-e1954]|nr:MAG: hypothetical protein M1828_004100 [Chrysothrix sp. TS-e1954]